MRVSCSRSPIAHEHTNAWRAAASARYFARRVRRPTRNPMLELILVLSVLALCLGALSVVGFAAALAIGVAMILALIFLDWLRHHTAQVQRWFDARFGERLRP